MRRFHRLRFAEPVLTEALWFKVLELERLGWTVQEVHFEWVGWVLRVIMSRVGDRLRVYSTGRVEPTI